MDKKYNDIHIVSRYDEYVIREVTDITLRKKGGFVEITYRAPMYTGTDMPCAFKNFLDPMAMLSKVVVPSMEGLKIYID